MTTPARGPVSAASVLTFFVLLIVVGLAIWFWPRPPGHFGASSDCGTPASGGSTTVCLVETNHPWAGEPVGQGCAWQSKASGAKALQASNPQDGSGATFTVTVENTCPVKVYVEFRLTKGPLKCVLEASGKRTDTIDLGEIVPGDSKAAVCRTGAHAYDSARKREDEYILIGRAAGAGRPGRYDPEIVLERAGDPLNPMGTPGQ